MIANTSPLKRCGTTNEKYFNDAQVLEKAIITEPENERYWYYLGQSYMSCMYFHDAIRAYNQRINMGGWDQETYFAMYQKAKCMEALNYPSSRIEEAYLKAWEFRPSRLEAITKLILILNRANRFPTAYALGIVAYKKARDTDIINLDTHIHECEFLMHFLFLLSILKTMACVLN